jgi:Mrp family chromosome partitioning ATPase/capsular polysaccharide biosynthesis protein
VELQDYLDILKRHRWAVFKAAVIVGSLAFLLSSLRTPQYRATTHVLLRPVDGSERLNPSNRATSREDSDRFVSAQVEVVTSDGVAREAAQALGHGDPRRLLRQVAVRQRGTSEVLEISATDGAPRRARDIANAFARAYIENRRSIEVASLTRAIDGIEDELSQLLNRIVQLDGLITGASGTPGAPPSDEETATGLDDNGRPLSREALVTARQSALRRYESLDARRQDLLVDVRLQRGGAEVITEARTPDAPFTPQPERNAALGVLGGVLLGLGMALLKERLDDRLRSAEELQRLTGLEVLAETPSDKRSSKHPGHLAAAANPLGPVAEAARTLRTTILSLGKERPVKLLLVASAGPGEGASLVAANLATVYAQAGYVTVLVSADLRSREAEQMFGHLPPSEGITGVVTELATAAGMATPSDSGVPRKAAGQGSPAPTGNRTNSVVWDALVRTDVPNLLVLPAGPTPPNPAEVLGSAELAAVLDNLADVVDMVIIDTPPVLAVSDAAILAERVEAVVLVAALRRTRRDAVQRAKQLLERSPARLLGAVVSNGTLSEEVAAYRARSEGKDRSGSRPDDRRPTSSGTVGAEGNGSFPRASGRPAHVDPVDDATPPGPRPRGDGPRQSGTRLERKGDEMSKASREASRSWLRRGLNAVLRVAR